MERKANNNTEGIYDDKINLGVGETEENFIENNTKTKSPAKGFESFILAISLDPYDFLVNFIYKY